MTTTLWGAIVEADRIANWLVFHGSRTETICTHAWACRSSLWALIIIAAMDVLDRPGHCERAWINKV